MADLERMMDAEFVWKSYDLRETKTLKEVLSLQDAVAFGTESRALYFTIADTQQKASGRFFLNVEEIQTTQFVIDFVEKAKRNGQTLVSGHWNEAARAGGATSSRDQGKWMDAILKYYKKNPAAARFFAP